MKRNALGLAAAAVLLSTSAAFAQQTNFQFMPAPVPYPSFEPNRNDFTAAGDYFKVSGGPAGSEFDIHGGGGHLLFRHAANEKIAVDGGFGVYGLSGDGPGFALPFIFGINLFNPVIEGKGKLTGAGFPVFLDLEAQLVNRPGGSVIVFGGPNMTLATFNMDTPYHGRSGSSNAPSTSFNTKSTVFLGGFQLGVQGGVRLGTFRVAPFYMSIFQSGNATFTFDDGYRSTDQLVTSDVVNIEAFVTQVFGFDVIYEPWNLSLGSVFQQAASTPNQEGYKTSMFTLAYHFRGK